MNSLFIQQQTELDSLIARMQPNQIYGLDTEFIKVDTLWPKLGVLQINLERQVYLLDGTTLDLTQFWHHIFQAKQNIFHACGEDIDLIYHFSKQRNLDNVFDTQVALAFLGYGLQISYQNALKLILNIDIEKDQTRSDWLARPLSTEQLNYAANDVLYIMQLAERIKWMLNEKKLLAYVEEDCRHLTYEIGQKMPLACLYQDIGHYRYSRRQLMQIQQLAQWREQLACSQNIPRSFILKNITINDLVEKNPKTIFQLSSVKNIRPNIIRDHGKTILALLKELPEPTLWPEKLPKPFRYYLNDTAQQIDNLVQKVSYQLDIPKEILLRKKWLTALQQHVLTHSAQATLPCYLLGWRYDLLTVPVIALLQADQQAAVA